MKKNKFKQIQIAFLAVFLCIGASILHAEIVTYKSALVWRSDGKGDFLLPENMEKVYELPQCVDVDGNIQTISASWNSEGAVLLQLSVDDGTNYYTVINGTPLKDFVQGRKIKWRAVFAEGSELYEVKIKYTDSLGIVAGFGEPALSGFKYRKAFFLRGSVSDLYEYQVYLKIGESALSADGHYDIHCEGNMKKDFQDVRFTAEDGETIIPHYMDARAGIAPERIAAFWIKVPYIPAEGMMLYIYYDNAQAMNMSSAEEVFEPAQTEGGGWIRKYADIEPKVDKEIYFQTEEKVYLPVFINTVLAPNGNVILAEDCWEGQYVTNSYETLFEARILAASCEGNRISMDISADNGGKYKNGCENNLYYYSAREDFTQGTRIRARVRFRGGGTIAELSHMDIDYSPGIITLIDPNGREVWQSGTARDILWSAWEYDFFYPIKIWYTTDNGRTYTEIAEVENKGIYSWKVPEKLISEKVRIMISDANDVLTKDESDEFFAIRQREK
ncbi:MAG: DUF2341 domain-containing protein [Candidatus Omnitrophota bacterium]